MLGDLRTRLAAMHARQPQELTRVALALQEVEHGLLALASLGHVFHLVKGAAPPVEEYPKKMFHVHKAPDGRLIPDRWAEEELGEGWHPTLEAAQHADGVETQFAGRGGVPRKGALVKVR